MNSAIAVSGAGAGGMALAIHAARLGHSVQLWARNPAPLRASRETPRLPGVVLDPAIITVDALPAADLSLLAVPVQHLRGVARGLPVGGALVVCCKGIEAATGRLPLEILAELHPERPAAVLTGPNFAREIAEGRPAAALIAASDAGLRTAIADQLSAPGFRLYGSADVLGAQLGGAAKNVIAIAAGCVSGAGLGENARAALVTRGVAELGRLVAALGGQRETAAGLSGLGDLVLTCTGLASRNFRLGVALGRGLTPGAALQTIEGVAEGVATAPALLARARDVDLPICAAVAALLAGHSGLDAAVAALLARPRRDEA